MAEIFKKIRFKKMFLLTAIYLAAGFTGEFFLYYFLPEHYFKQYYVIVLFFLFAGIITNIVLDRTAHYKEGELFSVYMTLRVAKFLLTLIVLVIFKIFVVEADKKIPFAIAMMGNYIIYTSFELYTFHFFQKRSTKNAKKE
jgi:ABC-type iron transport system FetAB permease component